MKNRYFVDERSGIVAVRDRVHTDPDYNGLHSDTAGVIMSWKGERVEDHWELVEGQLEKAETLCTNLNSGVLTSSDFRSYISTRYCYICECEGEIEWELYSEVEGTCKKCGRIYREFEEWSY